MKGPSCDNSGKDNRKRPLVPDKYFPELATGMKKIF